MEKKSEKVWGPEISECTVDAASRFESFFSLSLERQRIAGKTARRYTYTGASVFHRRQKFLRVRSSFGRAGKPTIALKWGGRTDRAWNKALWTH